MPRHNRTNYVPPLTALIFACTVAAWILLQGVDVHREVDGPPATPTQTQSKSPAQASPSPKSHQLAWKIQEGLAADRAALAACLVELGFEKPRVVGSSAGPLVVVAGRQPIRQVIRIKGQTMMIHTPISEPVVAALRLHIATTECLYDDGAQVIDELLDRSLVGPKWPRLSRQRNVVITDVISIKSMATSYRTVGLSRLGRKDIELASNQGDGDDLMLIAATALSETEGTQELTVTGLGQVSISPSRIPGTQHVQAYLTSVRHGGSPAVNQPNSTLERGQRTEQKTDLTHHQKQSKKHIPQEIEIKRRTSKTRSRKRRRSNTPFRPDYR